MNATTTMRVLAAVCVATSVFAMPVQAAPIDFNTQITQIDGKPIIDDKGAPAPVTLKKVAVEALLTTFPDEASLAGEEKARRYVLAVKISGSDSGKIELTSEDVTMLRKVVGKGYGPLVVGQVWKIIDPAAMPK